MFKYFCQSDFNPLAFLVACVAFFNAGKAFGEMESPTGIEQNNHSEFSLGMVVEDSDVLDLAPFEHFDRHPFQPETSLESYSINEETVPSVPRQLGGRSWYQFDEDYGGISTVGQYLTRHELYHELAYVLVDVFDLPVLVDEVTIADSFAAYWTVSKHPRQAPQVIDPRIRAWILEGSQAVSDDEAVNWEAHLKIQRAYRTACLIYGANPAEWAQYFEWLEFPRQYLDQCKNTARQVIESWNSVLSRYTLPEHLAAANGDNVELIFGSGPMMQAMMETGVLQSFAEDLQKFHWPSGITIHFDHCEWETRWVPSDRTIQICDRYVLHNVLQGREVKASMADN